MSSSTVKSTDQAGFDNPNNSLNFIPSSLNKTNKSSSNNNNTNSSKLSIPIEERLQILLLYPNHLFNDTRDKNECKQLHFCLHQTELISKLNVDGACVKEIVEFAAGIIVPCNLCYDTVGITYGNVLYDSSDYLRGINKPFFNWFPITSGNRSDCSHHHTKTELERYATAISEGFSGYISAKFDDPDSLDYGLFLCRKCFIQQAANPKNQCNDNVLHFDEYEGLCGNLRITCHRRDQEMHGSCKECRRIPLKDDETWKKYRIQNVSRRLLTTWKYSKHHSRHQTQEVYLPHTSACSHKKCQNTEIIFNYRNKDQDLCVSCAIKTYQIIKSNDKNDDCSEEYSNE
eukprot:143888_1